ncbi:MAG: HNH endonuclease [Lachnospiraceae bacterium]|nr:HNH endonuclease [Lachnospiraceae bacterium]
MEMGYIIIAVLAIPLAFAIGLMIANSVHQKQLAQLNQDVLQHLNLQNWQFRGYDFNVKLKSSKAVEDYSHIKLFKDNRDLINAAYARLEDKASYADILSAFLQNNEYKNQPMYSTLEETLTRDLKTLHTFNVYVSYVSPAGRSSNQKILQIDKADIDALIQDPSLIMGKAEYNKFIKEQNQEMLNQKCHLFYEKVNNIIDTANSYREKLINKDDQNELDRLISSLFDKTVNSIKKIKTPDSEEWDVIEKIITSIDGSVKQVIDKNQQILDYYDSPEFEQIKSTCNALMDSQRDFNEYINEKAQSISALFGSRVVRGETEINDEYNYIRPYKKSITPFTAEVSAQVFASAENSPLEYIVKTFYPNKDQYPIQIQKLQFLVEELETLKDAKEIIEAYKKDYQQYLTDVPAFIMENDEDGFYSRLGFANISENILTVEYKFSYTSNGGMAQRSFVVPMTEETIVKLIEMLQSKLTMSAFAKEQRALMTSKLRQFIKERDNFTCKICGNSTYNEPNLLLEIDHIVSVADGGCTVENNLQTLCWKCNRQKGKKSMVV